MGCASRFVRFDLFGIVLRLEFRCIMILLGCDNICCLVTTLVVIYRVSLFITEELKMSLKTLTKVSALALIAGLTVGCASTSDLAAVQKDANEAKATARNALDTAGEAKSIAMEAKSISLATEEKINRMFKKSMYK